MKLTIEGAPKEVAALALELQERLISKDKPCVDATEALAEIITALKTQGLINNYATSDELHRSY